MRWPPPPDWPMAAHSRLIDRAPHRWHVQEAGEGPLALLLHGAGGATQSWRGLFPLLAARRRVVAVDLPGQGFTRCGVPGRLGLDAMAEDLAALMAGEGWAPDLIVGHSAGGALALRLATMPAFAQARIVGLNAALEEWSGVAGWMMPRAARALAAAPFAGSAISALAASPSRVRGLIEGTGSTIDAAGLGFYLRLVRDPDHVAGTIGMMARWSVSGVNAALGAIAAPVLLIAGERDRAVPPRVADRTARALSRGRSVLLPRLGHLMHEEDPDAVLAAIEGAG